MSFASSLWGLGLTGFVKFGTRHRGTENVAIMDFLRRRDGDLFLLLSIPIALLLVTNKSFWAIALLASACFRAPCLFFFFHRLFVCESWVCFSCSCFVLCPLCCPLWYAYFAGHVNSDIEVGDSYVQVLATDQFVCLLFLGRGGRVCVSVPFAGVLVDCVACVCAKGIRA